MMRVLGIDPGYGRCGVAVLECTNRDDVQVLYSACISTPKDMSPAERLEVVSSAVAETIERYKPSACAIEKLYFSKNKKTALAVAEARGAVLAIAASGDLAVYEYDPSAVKIAVTGHGRSDKKEMMKMLPKLLDLSHEPKHDDEYDALAVALTHCVSTQGEVR